MPNLMLFLLGAAVATACLATPPEASDPDEAEARQADVVVVPLCGDKTKDVRYPAGCTLPGNIDGIRNCVDHYTYHYSIHLNPAPKGPSCELDSTEISTDCGLCHPPHGSDGPDGPDGPLGPLDP